uniref:Uncharacterized protein n=1 Tax=Rhabditophanes sp. KR3021 TaxID=114890 RepID=A0AC35TT73_9BILA
MEELKKIEYVTNYAYPINIMRNTARRGSKSAIQIVSDIENIFSANFSQIITKHLHQWVHSDQKIAYIFWRFESSEINSLPRTMNQLYSQIHRNTSVFFHRHVYPQGHLLANLSMWLTNSLSPLKLSSTLFNYSRYSLEPQTILRHNDPYHFEKVPTRLHDQQVLINELCRAGYTFQILTHVFNVHPGIKRKQSLFEDTTQKEERKKLSKFKRLFKYYLDNKYPPNKITKCPGF